MGFNLHPNERDGVNQNESEYINLEKMLTPQEALAKYWGFSEFRGVQLDAIKSVLRGEDVVVLMATGGGKSLCYCIPPLVMGKLVIVISPLIALMIDQVTALRLKGIRADYLASAQPDATVFNRALRGEYQLLYCTPERAVTFRAEMVASLDPGLIAIDEAHCVSEWGHDFRPEYANLSKLRAIFPDVPLMALTATATPDTKSQIVSYLHMHNPQILQTTFDRPNLAYSVHEKSTHALYANLTPHHATIIYLCTTREVDTLCRDLNARGVHAVAYHSKLTFEARNAAHTAFTHDEADVMCATLGYGMGVDKPDVRMVIHWGAPKTIEAFYQQSGRAGRDGLESQCVLFTSHSDWPRLAAMIGTGPESIIATDGLQKMRKYVNATTCRRRLLVVHFGEYPDWTRCEMCDVCKQCETIPPSIDHTKEARQVLAAVHEAGGFYGLLTPIKMLCGKVPSKQPWLASRPSFGIAIASYDVLRVVGERLLQDGYLTETRRQSNRGSYMAISLSVSGQTFLDDVTAQFTMLGLVQTSGSIAEHPVAPGNTLTKLKAVRAELAAGKPAYVVASNATLQEIVTVNPRTLDELRQISGIGAQRLEKYGDALLACLPRKGPSREMLLSVRRKLAGKKRVAPYMLITEPVIQQLSELSCFNFESFAQIVPTAIARELWDELHNHSNI